MKLVLSVLEDSFGTTGTRIAGVSLRPKKGTYFWLDPKARGCRAEPSLLWGA